MDCIIHNTGCSKIVIRTVVREGNLIPTRQYLLISYNSYISKFYFSCLFHALLLFFFSQNITSKLVKAFFYEYNFTLLALRKLYSSAIFFNTLFYSNISAMASHPLPNQLKRRPKQTTRGYQTGSRSKTVAQVRMTM